MAGHRAHRAAETAGGGATRSGVHRDKRVVTKGGPSQPATRQKGAAPQHVVRRPQRHVSGNTGDAGRMMKLNFCAHAPSDQSKRHLLEIVLCLLLVH